MRGVFALRLVAHELAWRARIWLLSRLLPGRHRNIFKELRQRGVVRIPGYYSEEELSFIEKTLNSALDRARGDALPDWIVRQPGSIRLRHLAKSFPALGLFVRDGYLVSINFLFSLRIAVPSAMYAITHDGSLSDVAVLGSASAVYGGSLHFDQWHHQLKAFTPLDEVRLENGPLAVLPGTSSIQWRAFEVYHRKYQNQSSVDGAREELRSLDSDFPNAQPECMLGQRGDLFLFDTRTVHKASALTKGSRRILWLYF